MAVESVIYRHPDVLEVAVIPIPDPKWHEAPKAFGGPREATTPKAVEFGELPETATGRIQKFKLRERERAGREHRVN